MAAEPTTPNSAPATSGSIWRSAASTIGTRAIDIPSRYGFHLLVAWKLGVVDAGAFYIVFSVLTLAAGAGRFGIDRAMTREVARALALNEPGKARAVIWRGMLLITGLSLVAGLIVALLAPILAENLFDNPRLKSSLVLAGLTIVPLCLSAGAAGAIAGLHRVATSQMVYSWLWPGIFCVIALPLALTLVSAFVLLIVATTVTALLSLVLLARARPEASAEQSASLAPPLMALGWSLFTTEIVQVLFAGLPALVLGVFASEAEVGAYAMAWRLALVLNLLTVAVAAMASPRFAECAARGDDQGLRRTAAQSLGLVLAMSLLPMVILTLGAPWFLALFGEGFASGAGVLRLLVLGQAVLLIAATAPELLGMTGHEKIMQHVNTLTILTYTPLLCCLSWLMAGEGAALANIVASVISGGGALWLAHSRLGFTPPGALLKVLRERFKGTSPQSPSR